MTNKKILLPYGGTTVPVSVPDSATVISAPLHQSQVDRDTFLKGVASLLEKKGQIKGQVAIVIADKTRLCGYDYALSWLIEALQHREITDDQITFYIAYGTHGRQSDEECLAAYGDVYRNYPFIHHSCTKDAMVSIGKTTRGTNIHLRRDILEAELIMTFGAVSHHYFAGYGGGRKLLFPGLAGRDGIYQNHSLFLDTQHKNLSRGCLPGNLSGNPLAEDLKEIHDLLPQYVSIHGLLNSEGEVIQFFFGSEYSDFLSVCKRQDQLYLVKDRTKYELVIGSAGGFPKDINFIQSHKSLHNCSSYVKDRGTLILCAECRDQTGSSTFLPWFSMGYERAFERLSRDYQGNGGTALAMMEKTKRINILMHTSLSREICQKINVNKIGLGEMKHLIQNTKGTIGIFTNGSMLV